MNQEEKAVLEPITPTVNNVSKPLVLPENERQFLLDLIEWEKQSAKMHYLIR